MPRLLFVTLMVLGLYGLPAPAAHGAELTCSQGSVLNLGVLIEQKNSAVAHLWGKENMALLSQEPNGRSGVLRIAYPAGSFSPGQSAITGGAGFEYHGGRAPSACLSYRVRFPAGFDFVKGGKLPGLFGGDDPRGCVAGDKVTGFSARLMWRSAGAGELYLYAPGRDTRCGQSIGRGAWTFSTGVWTTITERATMNTPGAANGRIEIWVDGNLVVRADGLSLGLRPDSAVDGLLFSTFFGGSDASWATPRDQAVDFANFSLSFDRD